MYREFKRMDVLLDDPLAFEMFLSHAAMRRTHRRIYKMLNTCGFGGIGNIFSLSDLAFETNIRQPEILHAKDAVRAFECRIEFSAVIHIACDEFRAEGFQFLCGRLVDSRVSARTFQPSAKSFLATAPPC